MAIAPDPFALAADIFDPPVWEPQGRPKLEPHQIPPDGEWTLFLLEGGRGSGKTEASARYFASHMRRNPGHRGRIIAPTFGDAVESCIMGPSGLLKIDPEIRFIPSSPGGAKVVWPNGSEALVLGTPSPRDVDRLRAGGNRHIDWWEEMAANPQLEDAWAQAEFGLRLGSWPHSIASTTPRRTAAYRKIRKTSGVVFRRATMFDNPHNPKAFVDRMRERYEGTRIGRQELYGVMLDDVEGALWRLDWIDRFRVREPPSTEYRAMTVALDPADGTATGDEMAICVAGLNLDNDFYVLLSEGHRDMSQVEWITRALNLCREHNAKLVWEANHGGAALRELIQIVMGQTGIRAPMREVWASTGKTTRAEPVAALYEGGAVRTKGRIRHIGEFLELEEQMTTFTGKAEPGKKIPKSPDRLDACLTGGTMILTSIGLQPLSQVRPGDLVWTRAGWRAVRRAERTGIDRPVRSIVLADGRCLCGTADHPVWVESRGFVALDTVSCGDRVQVWTHLPKSCSPVPSTDGTQTLRSEATASTTSLFVDPACPDACPSTAPYGRASTDRYRMACTSTTTTRTPSTTTPQTSSSSRLKSTLVAILKPSAGSRTNGWRTWTRSEAGQQNGMPLKRALRGTPETATSLGKDANHWRSALAHVAASRFARGSSTLGSALDDASSRAIAPATAISEKSRAQSAGPRSGKASTGPSPKRALGIVVRNYAEIGGADVFNLEVDGMPEFVANGILVHNCVWALTDLIGYEHPRRWGRLDEGVARYQDGSDVARWNG